MVAAATEAFARGGYNGVSLRDIAARLDMTPAGVLHHFGTKEELLTAVLEARDRDEVDREHYATFPHGADYLAHMVRTVKLNAERRGITQLYTVLAGESVAEEHPAQDWFRSRYEGLRHIVDDALRLAAEVPDGALVAESLQAAEAVIAVMDGMQIQWLLDDRVAMAPTVRRVIDMVVADLRNRVAELTP